MTAPQFLTIASALDATWTFVAVAAWLSSAAALGAVVVWRWADIHTDLLALGACALQVSRGAHSAGRHHRSGGKHSAEKLQGNPPPAPERLDGPPTTAPEQPVPKGGER